MRSRLSTLVTDAAPHAKLVIEAIVAQVLLIVFGLTQVSTLSDQKQRENILVFLIIIFLLVGLYIIIMLTVCVYGSTNGNTIDSLIVGIALGAVPLAIMLLSSIFFYFNITYVDLELSAIEPDFEQASICADINGVFHLTIKNKSRPPTLDLDKLRLSVELKAKGLDGRSVYTHTSTISDTNIASENMDFRYDPKMASAESISASIVSSDAIATPDGNKTNNDASPIPFHVPLPCPRISKFLVRSSSDLVPYAAPASNVIASSGKPISVTIVTDNDYLHFLRITGTGFNWAPEIGTQSDFGATNIFTPTFQHPVECISVYFRIKGTAIDSSFLCLRDDRS